MKRIAISFALMVSLLIPTASPVNAAEKCLANFADSEWATGTPAAVKSLLGFDLVETIKKPQTPQTIHRYFLYGEHTVETVYSYQGKNCLNRDIKITTLINAQTRSYEYETLSEYLKALKSPNFLWSQNTTDYYTNLRDYYSQKIFIVNSKQLLSGNEGHPKGIQELLRKNAELYSSGMFVPAYAFLYFPTRCAHWINSNGEKLYAVSAGHAYAEYDSKITFNSNGECTGELRLSGFTDGLIASGVKEKIADIKYVVKNAQSTLTITCKKGKAIRTVKGTNPKCPAGYKKA
jgi:hypothetical protein